MNASNQIATYEIPNVATIVLFKAQAAFWWKHIT